MERISKNRLETLLAQIGEHLPTEAGSVVTTRDLLDQLAHTDAQLTGPQLSHILATYVERGSGPPYLGRASDQRWLARHADDWRNESWRDVLSRKTAATRRLLRRNIEYTFPNVLADGEAVQPYDLCTRIQSSFGLSIGPTELNRQLDDLKVSRRSDVLIETFGSYSLNLGYYARFPPPYLHPRRAASLVRLRRTMT